MIDPNIDGDVRYMLGEIKGRLDALIQAVNTRHDEIQKHFDDVDGEIDKQGERISALERMQYLVMGGAGVAAAIISFVIDVVTK